VHRPLPSARLIVRLGKCEMHRITLHVRFSIGGLNCT
jgi:hypothetical protein